MHGAQSVCFLFQGMKPNAEATDESEVRSSSLHHFVEMVYFPKRKMQGWNGFASSSESSKTVSVRQICHAVAPEKHLLQHIVSVRGVHSSVKPGWFLSSNKAQCQPMGCNTSTQFDPWRIFVRLWDVSNTHELQIAFQNHQYYDWTRAFYSIPELLRLTHELNKKWLYTPARQEAEFFFIGSRIEN